MKLAEGVRGSGGETGPRIRLLLVDDDPTVSRLLARCFARVGWSVSSACSSPEAEACESEWDCGVFDIDLGSACGLTLAERLLDQGRVSCAVFYSGTLDKEHIARARKLGHFILKPATFDEIREGVLRQLKTTTHGGG